MDATDMPIVAVWDKWEWPTKVVDKEIESADKKTESNDVVEAENDLYYDRCGC
ncbi:hypothetical protein A2U01_0086673, partial [Trifolium medium]|nr:hypothetical protein [Trifolium medium]